MALITIGMPVYNGAATLGAALDSLQAQTVRDFRLIISDNGSTDATADICAEYARMDDRITYIRQPTNLGAAMNFRFVLMAASTPYFMWAAADDLWAPIFIERHLATLAARPDCVLSQSRVLFTVNGRPSHISTGTFPLDATPQQNAVDYFTNPADNSRYYGVFRTEPLQRVFPGRGFFGIDWAVAGSTTRYGKHAELPDVLMVRDSSEPQVYANMVAREHRFWLWRTFPLLPMTIHIIRAGHVKLSFRLLVVLIHVNLYIHFRFGIYRFQRLADEYLKTNSVRSTTMTYVAKTVNYVTLPGIRTRVMATVRRRGRWLFKRFEAAGRKFWQALPFPLELRFRIKKYMFRLFPSLSRHLQGFSHWRPHEEADSAAARNVTALSEGPWQRLDARPSDGQPADFSVIVVAGPVLATLGVVESIVRNLGAFTAGIIVVDVGAQDVSPVAFAGRDDLSYLSFPAGTSLVSAVQKALVSRPGSAYAVILEQGLSVEPGFFEAAAAGLALDGAIAPSVLSTDGRLLSMEGWFTRDLSDSSALAERKGVSGSNLTCRIVDFSPRALVARFPLLCAAGGLNVTCKTLHAAFAHFGAQMKTWGERFSTVPTARLVDHAPSETRNDRLERQQDWMLFASAYPAYIDATEANLAILRRGLPVLLYVDADTPTPDQNAGSIEALNLMRIFADLGYDVLFIPESNFIHRGTYTDQLLLHGIDAIWYPRYASVQDVLRDYADRLETVVLCRAYIAEKYIEAVRAIAPQAKVVFNMVDVHFMRLEREAALTGNVTLAAEAARMKESEYDSIAKSDATIVVSSFEQQLLSREIEGSKVHLIPLVREIPATLDVPDFTGRADIVFIGTYQHPPNVDAVIFFAHEVWPHVRAQIPEARFLIVGSQVTPAVQDLAGEEGIEVLGFVQDLDPLLAKCRLSVAPLRFGAGIKGKVGTALQAGLPTVATSIAVEGTPLVPGQHVLVADAAEDFADAVVRAYTDPELWNKLSKAGFQFVKDDYSFETNIRRINALLADIQDQKSSTEEDHQNLFEPSAFWKSMQSRNALAVQGQKLRNFKRTINNNYFQWLPGDFSDPQVASLIEFWKDRPSFWPISAVAESVAGFDPSDVVSFDGNNPFAQIPGYMSFYAFFTGLRWYHAACNDPHRYHEIIEEPEVGNPIRVRMLGKLISQDLANSLDEWCAVEHLGGRFAGDGVNRVLEIGAGYGRLAYVALSVAPVRYVIVDIEPALGTAAWYLRQTLPGKTIFGPEDFNDWESVSERLTAADIVFLKPSQLEFLPDSFIDISVSISSLHEMRLDQVVFYVSEIDRLTKKAVYLKQWKHWHNEKDDIVIQRENYILPPHWTLVLDRPHQVMSDFVELGFVKRVSD